VKREPSIRTDLCVSSLFLRESRFGGSRFLLFPDQVAMLKVALSDNPPAHLLLGSDAVRLVEEKIKSLQADFDAWKSVSLSTDVA
jgi:hypothetical protein